MKKKLYNLYIIFFLNYRKYFFREIEYVVSLSTCYMDTEIHVLTYCTICIHAYIDVLITQPSLSHVIRKEA